MPPKKPRLQSGLTFTVMPPYSGVRDRDRTYDLPLRRQTLYPTELHGQTTKLVDRQGLEPSTPACKAGIFPAKLTAHWCILSTIHRLPSPPLSNGHN